MNIEKYRHPVVFYVLSTVIPWSFWFLAAYLSHMASITPFIKLSITVLLIVGLCAPAAIAFLMIGANPSLRSDLKTRFFNLKQIRPGYLFLTCFLMLASILLAQAISLFFGYSTEQFSFAKEASFSGGVMPGWFWLFFAPVVEELAWHTYGTDCLRQRMNLLYTSLLFALYWAFWHYPAFLIKGYYQSNMEQIGLIYSMNFMFSIIPFVILMNWLYYKTSRSILIPIVFHITAGFFNELFNTNPNTKIIQTALLTILAVFLVLREKNFFLQRAYSEE